jgi:hypothetical protein
MLRAVQTAGTYVALGLLLCVAGWLIRSVLPTVAFFMWFFGVPIAVLGVPFGLVVWLGNRRETPETAE